ncbi:ubiquinol-cytochrome C chaperone family protein [Geminicoccus flavidas]|uniref:ubiquinol-cytochrome C chaperone family protein n=1 Tax=Geminicoccus flavidas TaxID=2506407 RepID=UPI0013578F83|nr:ubiquinol-cytochrome C chaperone family protein [Geminicoccus flavidas]
MNSSQQGGIVAGLRRLLGGGQRRRMAERLYAEAVERARRPELYARMGVADTPAGRYEMVAWQVLVQLAALGDLGADGRRLGQEIVDRMFLDMDRSLRELGVGDLSVGREMRKLGETWQARTELAERVFPPAGTAVPASAVTELGGFLQKNAGEEGRAVDGPALAEDLFAILAELRGRPIPTPPAAEP